MQDNSIKKVVIVGGGTAGWMAASALVKVMGLHLEIELIESEEISTIGVGEATIPPIQLFNNMLGLDEDDFLKNCQGTYKLGIDFQNWAQLGDSYMHGFGDIGRDVGLIRFYQYWLRSQSEGHKADLWDYSINTQAALQNKFTRASTLRQGQPDLTYAFHFDARLYAAYLRRLFEALGVKRTEGKISHANLNAMDGSVESVTLENGTVIDGDLFIDCSGLRGLLIEQELKTGYENWQNYLPCDRAIAVPCENSGPLRPYTQSIAHQAGWQWRIPLQHRTGNGHVFCSEFISEDEATAILMNNLEGEAIREPFSLKFSTGRRKKFWNKNVVALGLSSGFMEPLESTSIHLIQAGVIRLLKLFPDKGFNQTNIDEYNRQTIFEYERIRNFIILHYKANQRIDSPFWQHCAAMPVPEALAEKMDLFRANGRIFREGEELFTELGWLQVMLGQGIVPETYHPLADMLSDQQLGEYMANVKAITEATVAKMPSQNDFIAHHCAAGQ